MHNFLQTKYLCNTVVNKTKEDYGNKCMGKEQKDK